MERSQRNVETLSFYNNLRDCCFCFFLSLVFAVFIVFMIEMPAGNIEKLVFQKEKKKIPEQKPLIKEN